jgi:hypothetical protein
VRHEGHQVLMLGDEFAPVLAIQKWATNADLIAACARLGNLRPEWRTLDVTYGYGTFWNVWRPDDLTGCDINPAKSPIGYAVDFTALPFADRSFDAVVFDPPYKLNGKATDEIDERYGVDVPKKWQERMALLRAGAKECARVADKVLLVKCQDQVVSSVIRWQTRAVADEVEPLGFGLKHRFDFESFRPQPEGRAQLNPYACSSQLLVFERGWWWSDLPRPEKDAS